MSVGSVDATGFDETHRGGDADICQDGEVGLVCDNNLSSLSCVVS